MQNISTTSTSELKEEYILDPTMSNFILLDNISRKTVAILKSQETVQKTLLAMLEQQKLSVDQITNSNKQLSLSIEQQKLALEQQKLILEQHKLLLEQQILATKELKEDADEGAYITKADTASSSEFYIVDTQIDPGHMVKGYIIHNDGDNSIYVGHNIAQSSIGPDLVNMIDADLNSTTNRFNLIKSCERYQYSINRKKIKNIYLLATKNTSQFRITLTW